MQTSLHTQIESGSFRTDAETVAIDDSDATLQVHDLTGIEVGKKLLLKINLTGVANHLTVDAKVTKIHGNEVYVHLMGGSGLLKRYLDSPAERVAQEIKQAEKKLALLDAAGVLNKLRAKADVDADVELLHTGLSGSREFPAESAEVEVNKASTGVTLPELDPEEYKVLPREFILEVPYTYSWDDNHEVELSLKFRIRVKGYDGRDLEYEDTLLKWDYA